MDCCAYETEVCPKVKPLACQLEFFLFLHMLFIELHQNQSQKAEVGVCECFNEREVDSESYALQGSIEKGKHGFSASIKKKEPNYALQKAGPSP